MSETIGGVEVEVRAPLDTLDKDLSQAEARVAEFDKATSASAQKAGQSIGAMGEAGKAGLGTLDVAAAAATSALDGLGHATGISLTQAAKMGVAFAAGGAAAATAATAIAGLVDVLFEGATLSEKYAQSQRLTENSLRATGHTAGLTGEEIHKLSEQLGRDSLFNALDIEQASRKMLTFRSVTGDAFREAMKLSVDLASSDTGGFGSVSAAAGMVGRALQDPIRGLSQLQRAGIVLEPTQVRMIKNFEESGEHAKAVTLILESLTAIFGGSAAASNQGLTGAISGASTAWHEFLVEIGKEGPIKEAEGWLADATANALDFATAMLKARGAASSGFGAIATKRQEIDNLQRLNAETDPSLIGIIGLRQQRIADLEAEISVLQSSTKAEQEKSEAEKAAGAARKKLDEESRRIEAERALVPARGALASAEVDARLAIVQAGNAREQAMNESAHNQGLISDRAYYARATALAQEASQQEIDALESKKKILSSEPADGEQGELEQRTQILQIDTQIAQIRGKGEADRVQLSAQATLAEIGHKNELLQMESQLIGSQKARHEAELAAIDEVIRKYNDMLVASDVPQDDRTKLVESAREAANAHLAFQDATREAEQAMADMGTRIALIHQQAERGIISDAQAQQEILALQRDRIPVLDSIIEKMEAMERLATSPEQKKAIDDLRVSMGELEVQTDTANVAFSEASRTLGSDLRGATKGLFRNLLTDGKNWKDHLLGFFGQIGDAFANLAATMATKALFGDLAGGAAGGLNWTGLLGNLAGSLFGGFAGSAFGGSTINSEGFGGGDAGFGHFDNSGLDFSDINVPVGHSGGPTSFLGGMRTVPAETFINAPRYHKGVSMLGIGGVASALGLRHDERAAILQTGETVVPRGGWKNTDRAGQNNWYITTKDVNSFMASRRQIQRVTKMELGVDKNKW